MLVGVALPRPLSQPFTYEYDESLGPVTLGAWVSVPFGRGNTETRGYVVALEPPRPEYALKAVRAVGGPEESIPPDVFELCVWASRYYHAPWGEILRLALPSQLIGKTPKPGPHDLESRVGHLPELTAEQKFAADQILSSPPGHCTLLEGATGSGKTHVYLDVAQRTLAEGRSVLLLVPEIALTPQLHSRLEEGLGRRVALWHSAQAEGKRRQTWHDLRQGRLRVAVGARSAVFLPLQDLGLIVLDEEHDPSFKQEDRVRYHARELALVRANLGKKARAVLGSATPSLESLVRVEQKKFSHAVLRQRFSGHTPPIERVDLAEGELVEGTQNPLAPQTLEALRSTLESGDQAMVFLNRRGFAHFLLCKDCRTVPECKNCSVSLTVHHRPHRLACHWCGYQASVPKGCSACKSANLLELGGGTEALQEDLARLLPAARIARLDRDVITSHTRLRETLDAFREGHSNLLIGTQMLAKGHDFPNVTLVVVALADGLFRLPDYRCRERAVQMLQQVAGRAARGQKPGRVLVQTYDPDHPVLRVLCGEQTIEDFRMEELEIRKATGFPPAGRMARLRFSDRAHPEAWRRATQVAQWIERHFSGGDDPAEVLGPVDAAMSRVKNIFRVDVLIKAKTIQTVQAAISRAMLASPGEVAVDFDPSGLG